MQIYTETLTNSLSVKLPQELVTLLQIEPGDTVVFQVSASHALISGLELAATDALAPGNDAFSEWASDADKEAYRTL
ncbi:MAG: hypothetical protein ABJN62_13015 [Halioglobus sp.]